MPQPARPKIRRPVGQYNGAGARLTGIRLPSHSVGNHDGPKVCKNRRRALSHYHDSGVWTRHANIGACFRCFCCTLRVTAGPTPASQRGGTKQQEWRYFAVPQNLSLNMVQLWPILIQFHFPRISTLKMQAIYSSETSMFAHNGQFIIPNTLSHLTGNR
jgi:hypothetical protein